MNDEYTIRKMATRILQNSWKIIILMVLAAAWIGLPFSFQKGNFDKTNIIKITEHIEFTGNALIKSSKQYERYNNIWFKDVILSRFLQYTEKSFDMEMVCPGWSTKTEAERLKWVNEVLYCNALEGKPQYIIYFSMTVTDSNYEYMKVSAPKIFEKFINYNTANIQHLYKNSDNKVLSYSFVTKRDVSNTKETIKYFIVGAILGLISGLFLVLLPYLIKPRERRMDK
jgi:hypothetical protein